MKIGDTIKIKGYRYLPHTADVKFVAFGKSMEKAFDNSAMALFDTIAEVKELERRDEKVYILKLKANSDDIKDLLWKMLQRCLSVSDSKGLFCYKCSSKITIKNKKYFLNYVVSCRKKNVECSKLEVKGISKYDMEIKKSKNGIRITAVVDV